MSRSWPSFIGVFALAMPLAPSAAASMTLAICGLPGVTVNIPLDTPPMPADHGCCKGACHAGCERKQQRRVGARGK